MSDWDPAQYEKFRDERSLPFFDLLDLVCQRPGLSVIDLGCGTGALTAELHRRLAAASTLGIDRSETMLARAGGLSAPGLSFRRGDLTAPDLGGPYDLVFSNAAIQWAPDHDELLARLVGLLRRDGQLAIQVPANFDQPTHVVARELVAEEPFASALAGRRVLPAILTAEHYARRLALLGAREQVVRLHVYLHRLESREAVFDWVRGTTLTGIEAALPAALFTEYVNHYRERLLARLPDERPFLFPFRRLFLHATFT